MKKLSFFHTPFFLDKMLWNITIEKTGDELTWIQGIEL